MRKITLKDTVYKKDIFVVCNIRYKEFVEYINKRYKDTYDENEVPQGEVFQVENKKKEQHFYIWIKELNREEKWLGVLTHELFHVVIFVMRHIEMPLSEDSDEAYTHYFESLFRQVYKKIK